RYCITHHLSVPGMTVWLVSILCINVVVILILHSIPHNLERYCSSSGMYLCCNVFSVILICYPFTTHTPDPPFSFSFSFPSISPLSLSSSYLPCFVTTFIKLI